MADSDPKVLRALENLSNRAFADKYLTSVISSEARAMNMVVESLRVSLRTFIQNVGSEFKTLDQAVERWRA